MEMRSAFGLFRPVDFVVGGMFLGIWKIILGIPSRRKGWGSLQYRVNTESFCAILTQSLFALNMFNKTVNVRLT